MPPSNKRVPNIRFSGFVEEWRNLAFGDTFCFLKNNTLSRAELVFQGHGAQNIHYGDVLIKFGTCLEADKEEIPFIRENNLTNISAASYLREGDIIIADTAEDSAVGKCCEIIGGNNLRLVAGLHTIPCRPQTFFSPAYLGYYLNSPSFHDQLLPLMQGIKVIAISKSAIILTNVRFPSINEQSRIGQFFRTLDKLIELWKKKLDKLIALKRELLNKLFPQQGQKIPAIRFSGFVEEWKEVALGEIGDARSGVGFPDVEQGGKEGIPFFKVSDMNIEGNENELKRAANYVSLNQINRRGWKPVKDVPAIFFAKVGAAVLLNRKRLCKQVFLCDNNTMSYSLYKTKWDADFAKALFETVNLADLVQVGALPSYNASDVESLHSVLPELDEQSRIGQFFRTLDKLIELRKKEVDKMTALKKELLNKLFVG